MRVGDPNTAIFQWDLEDTYPNFHVAPREIAGDVKNYYVPVLDHVVKYTNEYGTPGGPPVGAEEWFHLQTWTWAGRDWRVHFGFTNPYYDPHHPEGGPQPTLAGTIIHVYNGNKAPNLPPLRYKAFYYNACNSGRDYISSFQHGVFFYTTFYSASRTTTMDFIRYTIEGNSWENIKSTLNGDEDEIQKPDWAPEQTVEYKSFETTH